jgi:predicted ABC-type ATPase
MLDERKGGARMTDDQIRAEALAYATLHKKRLAASIADTSIYPSEDEPVSIFMAGSPGAGKTEASLALIKEVGGAVLRIDPDELRPLLPNYTGANSWLFQPAVTVIVERTLDHAFRNRQSFLLDGTLTNPRKAHENISRSLKRNRAVQILYVYQDPCRAWEFVKAREVSEGRRIEKEVFIKQYFEARSVVNWLKAEFKDHIKVDLILQNDDNSRRAYAANVELIDGYVAESYDHATLSQILP